MLDEGLGRYVIAEALKGAGARVEIHADHFKSGELDDVWLAEAARRDWIILTKDYRIRSNRGLALRAIQQSKARIFVIKRSKDLRGQDMAEMFVKALPAIFRTSDREMAPFICKVGKDGSVSLWWPARPKTPSRK